MSKVLAIGDIHTKTWIVEQVENVVDNYDRIVFCGDYADDFAAKPQATLHTWSMLKKLQDKHPNKVSLVLGNHDYIYVYDTPSMQTGYNPTTHLLIDLPDNKKLRDWLRSLPIIVEIDQVMYSHAGITNKWSGAQDVPGLWNDTSPIWSRPNRDVAYKKIPQVFGHTPMTTCSEVHHNAWCIDTFSTMPDGEPFGDGSVLEITDGTKFSKIYLK